MQKPEAQWKCTTTITHITLKIKNLIIGGSKKSKIKG